MAMEKKAELTTSAAETLVGREGNLRSARFFLRASEAHRTLVYPLLHGQDVVVGRTMECDVVLNDPLVSRRHMRVQWRPEGPAASFVVEDLDSVNGTMLGDRLLAARTPTDFGPGQSLCVGSTVLVVTAQARTLPVPPQWTSWDDLEREIRRNRNRVGSRRGLGLVRLRISGVPRPLDLGFLLAELLEAADRVAWTTPAECRVLLADSDEPATRSFLKRAEDWLLSRGVHIAGVDQTHLSSERLELDPWAAISAFFDGEGTVNLARGEVVVRDPAMRKVLDMVDRVARSDVNILILGETGAGKDVVAAALHERSQRAAKPLVQINCAALSESLLESELFGHEAGAFTGARGAKPGLIEVASSGTVFLDEVGELPPSIQAKFLRVLESKELVRVGGVKARPVDVRFVAATNRDLAAAVKAGEFRQDLLFRLNGIALHVPPLRERAQDIEPLCAHFLEQANRRFGRLGLVMTEAALACIRAYPWPGNVRELKSVIERAVLLCPENAISVDDLGLADPGAREIPAPVTTALPEPTTDAGLKARILEVLNVCGGNQGRAAKMLGMSRRTLTNKLNKLKLPRPRKQD